MKSWNPKLKFFPSIQDDKVSSWLHTMIVEHKNSGEKKLWLSFIFQNGLLELRDKFYKSRPFISKSQGALKIS